MRRESLRPLLPLYNKCKGTHRSRLVLFVLSLVFLLLFLSASIHTDWAGDLIRISVQNRIALDLNGTISTTEVIDENQKATPIESSRVEPTDCATYRASVDELPDIVWYTPEELSRDEVSEGWEDEWISNGIVEENAQLKPIESDIIYTYVESNAAFQAMKATYDQATGALTKPGWENLQAKRYRSWNELKYSIRATIQYGHDWISKIHVVTKDFEIVDKETGESSNVLQIPSWLNSSLIEEEDSILKVVPESTVLTTNLCGPTFNSMSVEGSLGNVVLKNKHFIGMSDDMMFGRNITSSDFVSPLFGMSVSPYIGIWSLDENAEPNLNDGEQGEGHAARYTSYLLSQRFGKRPRALQIHQAKIMNPKILREALQTFPRPAELTPLSRYRDDDFQVYSWYLHLHFVAEMHREALLWSLGLRIDSNSDGLIDESERQTFLDEVSSGLAKDGERIETPILSRAAEALDSAGLPPFSIQKPIWTSMDGPMYNRGLSNETCNSDFIMETCLGSNSTMMSAGTPEEFLSQITDESLPVTCGDCLIKVLLNHAPAGLSPLLPTKEQSNYRASALKAIQKYQYLQTDPDNAFIMIRSIAEAKKLEFIASSMPGLLCINDDVNTRDERVVGIVAGFYNKFFELAYPIPSPFENVDPPPDPFENMDLPTERTPAEDAQGKEEQ